MQFKDVIGQSAVKQRLIQSVRENHVSHAQLFLGQKCRKSCHVSIYVLILRQLNYIMGSIFVIQGILIYIYGFDHNPPHIHVRSGTDDFSITIKDRIIEGMARSKTVAIINQFMDEHENELMDLWEKAQNGETIKKIR